MDAGGVTSLRSGVPAGRLGSGFARLGGVAVVLAFHLGKSDGERGTLAGLGPHGHFAAMVGNDVFDDAQAQPGASGLPRAGGIDPVEAFEDALLVLRR